MTKIRYVIYPGYVISRADGDRHWVGYGQLVRLYRLNPAECVPLRQHEVYPENVIHLGPRHDGHYEIPA